MKDERNGLKNEFTYWNEAHNEYDGVHPDKKGYLHMEKIIQKKLKEIL
jgi:lysophospholipase L1-like esterase